MINLACLSELLSVNCCFRFAVSDLPDLVREGQGQGLDQEATALCRACSAENRAIWPGFGWSDLRQFWRLVGDRAAALRSLRPHPAGFRLTDEFLLRAPFWQFASKFIFPSCLRRML